MYSKSDKHWGQWKTIIKHTYFRMKSYINQPIPQTENRPTFFLTWQNRANRRWEAFFLTIETVFLDCWKVSISSSHITIFLLKNNNLIVKNAGLTLSCLSDTFRKIHPTWQNEKIFNMENKCNKIISGILNWS